VPQILLKNDCVCSISLIASMLVPTSIMYHILLSPAGLCYKWVEVSKQNVLWLLKKILMHSEQQNISRLV